jgi:transposase-like protein
MKRDSVMELPIAQIRLDGGTQPRAALDFDAVDDYTEAIEGGAKFPPVVVFHDGENYWLADGFHRLKATFGAGFDVIRCEVHPGTLEEAQWYSFSANKTNGLRRLNEDKQRAVKAALGHPKAAGMSNGAIARHVGVNESTVREWRAKLAATSGIPKSSHRIGRDGRTINVANIGKQKSSLPAATASPAVTSGIPKSSNAPHDLRLDTLLWALKAIIGCKLAARDLASQLACRADRGQILKQMEEAREFLALCAAECQRAAR